jgi:hypothetical protein
MASDARGLEIVVETGWEPRGRLASRLHSTGQLLPTRQPDSKDNPVKHVYRNSLCRSLLAFVVCHLAYGSVTMAAPGARTGSVTPRPNWADSYSAGGKCYCASTFDHGVDKLKYMTPAGLKTIPEICKAIGPGPGKGKNHVYNTVQCGNPPAHQQLTVKVNGKKVKDEGVCPGRVDRGPQGCREIGPKWDLSVFTKRKR